MNYTTVQTSLNSIVLDQVRVQEFKDVVTRGQRLTVRLGLFLKTYLAHTTGTVVIDQKLVDMAFRVVGAESYSGSDDLYLKLKLVYDKWFLPQCPENDVPISRYNLDQTLQFESTKIVTNYYNNIVQHFPKYVQDYVDHHFGKWKKLAAMKTEDEKRQLQAFLTNAAH